MSKFKLIQRFALAVLAGIALPFMAFAQVTPSTAIPFTPGSGGNLGGAPCGSYTCPADFQAGQWNVGGLTGVGQTASVIRPANTTAYTGATAEQALCASTSSNCAPLQITLAGQNGATGWLGNVFLLKSGSNTANATFQVFFYSASPTVASIHDASTYLGPFAADLPSLVGVFNCNVPFLTSDATAQVYYRCTSTAPQGLEEYAATSGQKYVYAMIAVTGNYTPVSGEVFTVQANSHRDQ